MSIEITEEMVDQVAKIVADCVGNGMREKYIDVARDILTAVAPLMQAKVAELSAEEWAVLRRLKAALPDVGVNGWSFGVRALEKILAAAPEVQS
jgi:hypothetical protein